MKRWDTDERGRGIASGAAFVHHLSELAEAMADDAWVAEEPEAHLLPRLEAACATAGAPLQLLRSWSEDEVFVVELGARDAGSSIGELRRAAVALVAAIAEGSTVITQRRDREWLDFDVATGTAPGESGFAPHGHLVRLRVLRP